MLNFLAKLLFLHAFLYEFTKRALWNVLSILPVRFCFKQQYAVFKLNAKFLKSFNWNNKRISIKSSFKAPFNWNRSKPQIITQRSTQLKKIIKISNMKHPLKIIKLFSVMIIQIKTTHRINKIIINVCVLYEKLPFKFQLGTIFGANRFCN